MPLINSVLSASVNQCLRLSVMQSFKLTACLMKEIVTIRVRNVSRPQIGGSEALNETPTLCRDGHDWPSECHATVAR